MASLVLTVVGDDRAGLVGALADVIAAHGGNWERSRMAELSGKFAGVVEVSIADQRTDTLIEALGPLEASGLLDIAVERAGAGRDAAPAGLFSVDLIGPDQSGIIAEMSRTLAEHGISIDELVTDTIDAPMAGGLLFTASATLEVPDEVGRDELVAILDRLGDSLAVDIDVSATPTAVAG